MRYPGSLRWPARAGLCCLAAVAVTAATMGAARTSGVISGGALGWLLDDGSLLGLPPMHDVGADHEIVNGIGVAPDYYIPRTALDLATGRDPDIAKALALLKT